MTEPGSVGGFRRLHAETIYEGRVFRLVSSTFEAPNGDRFVREIVEHPGAVVVVPLAHDRTVTCVRQYRGPLGRHLLELPAGLLDRSGEDRLEAAKRELREEVGMVAATWSRIGTFAAAPGLTDEQYTLFVATDLVDVGSEADGPEEEHMTIETVRLEDVRALIDAGEIVDAKTAIGLLYVCGSGA